MSEDAPQGKMALFAQELADLKQQKNPEVYFVVATDKDPVETLRELIKNDSTSYQEVRICRPLDKNNPHQEAKYVCLKGNERLLALARAIPLGMRGKIFFLRVGKNGKEKRIDPLKG